MALTKVIGSGLGAIPAISGANLTGLTDSQMPAGSIIQVVETRLTSQFSTTNGGYVETGLRLSITPTDNNNKIALLATFSLYISSAFLYCTIERNHSGISATNLETSSGAGLCQLHAGGNEGDPSCISILDDPTTTNEITYNVQMKVQSGTGYLGINACGSFFRAMEVVV